jgi:GNAT superfamily N-acetyltransferase
MNPEEFANWEVGLFEVIASDVQAVEHFADAVLKDDFFFRRGHWLSLVADSRVQPFVIRTAPPGSEEWSEIVGLVVLYAESFLHNLFLSKQWRGLGLGTRIIEALAPTVIRAKTDMASGDPTGFYARLGYTHEEARKGRRGQIRVLTKPPAPGQEKPPERPPTEDLPFEESEKKNGQKGSVKGRKRS